jgi:hypothetical protein
MQGEIFGYKFYSARNPKWTKLGKAGKPMIGLRGNGQKPGMEGTGKQAIIRPAFARAAYESYGTYGKDERGMPNMANAVAAKFPANLRKSPEAKLQARREASARRHAATGAKLSGGYSSTYNGRVALPEYPF